MGRSFWYSGGFLFDADFAGLRADLGAQKIIGKVAQHRSTVRAGDAFAERAFSGLIFWSLFFQSGGLLALGNCCAVSIAIMLSSIAFALTAAASLYLVARHRHTPMNRVAYWHSVLVALAVSTVAVYMGYWGLIGLRLWAY